MPTARGPALPSGALGVGEDPVDDDLVDRETVQPQRRQRAAGLGQDDPLGGEDQADESCCRPAGCPAPPAGARASVAAPRSTATPGSGSPVAAAAAGRSPRSRPRWAGIRRSRCQASASGRASRRSVSAVGAQSTTTRSHGPDSTWVRSSSRATTSSAPGSEVSSSATTASMPTAAEDADQVALDLAPRLTGRGGGADLEGVQARFDLADRLLGAAWGVEVDPERLAERVRRVGGHDQRLDAGTGGVDGGGRRRGRLADTTLAGEQENAHGRTPPGRR